MKNWWLFLSPLRKSGVGGEKMLRATVLRSRGSAGVKFHEGHHYMMAIYFCWSQIEDFFLCTSVQYITCRAISKNILQAQTYRFSGLFFIDILQIAKMSKSYKCS